jgi:hypothetical protein
MRRSSSYGVLFLIAVVSISLLVSGCPKAKQSTTAPAEGKTEGKPEASGPVKTEGQPSSAKPIQELISSGSVLLNPDVQFDARLIQIGLQEAGLYKGNIDGLWGRGSRAALKAYKEKNSLANPEQWDKETQILLFGGVKK